MRTSFQKEYILVVSNRLVRWIGKMTTGSPNARAAAAFPFLMATEEDAETRNISDRTTDTFIY